MKQDDKLYNEWLDEDRSPKEEKEKPADWQLGIRDSRRTFVVLVGE